MKKKIDISTMYTKDRNKTKGRNGYGWAHTEKETDIPPKHFGEFLNRKRGKR